MRVSEKIETLLKTNSMVQTEASRPTLLASRGRE